MGGSQKSKRVTWASDECLCQVKLFLSEECPSQVGLGAQDHLQAKASWASHPGSMMLDDNLPPGFEGKQHANLSRSKISQIPVIKWGCPPRFVMNAAWRVVAGDESKEVEIQNQREMRVLEAIYPRPSAIPPNPSALSGAEDLVYSDQHTPLIPITPIEDEDPAADTYDSVTVATVPMNTLPQLLTSGASSSRSSTASNPSANTMSATEVNGVDPVLVASLTAFLSNNNQGSLIDSQLLVKLLSDPKMVEQLRTQTMPATSTQILPVTSMQNRSRQMFQPMSNLSETAHIPPISRTDQHLAHVTRPELVGPSVAAAAPNGVFYPPPSRVPSVPSIQPMVPDHGSAPSPSNGPPVTKDTNYFKSLIQQHGEDRQEILPQFGNRSSNPQFGSSIKEQNINPKQREMKPKLMKPCIYFNSSRGCRNGGNCPFQHDSTAQQRVSSMPDSHSAKRMKMDREITGM